MDRCNIFQSLTLNSTGLVSEQFQRLELSLLEETFPPFSDAKIDTCYTETFTFPRIFPQVQHLLWSYEVFQLKSGLGLSLTR